MPKVILLLLRPDWRSTRLISTAFTTDTGLAIFSMRFMGLGISGVFPTILGYVGDRFLQADPSIFAILVSTAIAAGLRSRLGIGAVAAAFGRRPSMAALALAALAFLYFAAAT